MLYPSFDELVALKHKAFQLLFPSDQKVSSLGGGNFRSPFRGQGLEFEEVREYASGDDIRAIDWRVTARTGKAHTKIFRESRERSVIICVDVNESMRFGTRGTFKSIQAARVAALLGWKASMSHDKIGFCLFGETTGGIDFYKPQRSRKPLWEMLKNLSTINNRDSLFLSGEEMLSQISQSISTGALVYMISDFSNMNIALEKQFTSLRRRCDVILIPIDDPADQFIPPIGSLFFCKNFKDKIYINTENKIGREAYTNQWQQTRESLQKVTRKLKIPLIPIATHADAVTELFLGLKHIQKMRRR
ncbi:MAG: DUF58 domain-containing protein [Alphaproteobacteria bacterium]|nr:DUF58 domain-containing protein [Alphaproteobacteria bacterium]